ncbi:acyltransferase [Rhodanobacter sp. MP7CTX1]|uniref:acyltransferase family protein n=1 Tax=Rhodanobacter sp. MP7CTX1 TaxID=2723084 RepID=UPI0016153C83|nr:acyltransferase [Rhodanobacter sp. MP7CTX1]MBB6187397.1 peptidoglycan/LPS O-acetylase OafA/YrhL [Rhodanobacter sp. MP7CTX1]
MRSTESSLPGAVNAQRDERNPGIDLLRGISILLVVLHHTGLRIPLKHTALAGFLPRGLLDGLNYNGYEAVFVFFVISGFLITGNTLKRWGSLDRIDVKAFYARRFARIVPCLLLLVVVLSELHLLGFDDYVINRAGQSLPRAIIAALGLHLNWYEGHTGYLPGNWDVLWSLSIEEVFYIGFPIVCLLTRRVWVLVPLLVLLALSLPATHAALADNEIWQEKAYLPGMAAIATGVLGALLTARWAAWPPRTIALLGWLGVIGLGAVMLDGSALWHLLHDGYMLVLTWSALCLVLATTRRRARGGWSAMRGLGWLRSFGRLSYEIYLTHMFVVYAIVRLFKAAGSDIGLGYFWYVPAVLVSWLLGMLVARLVSIPSDRALRRMQLKPVVQSERRDLMNVEAVVAGGER